MRLLLPRRAAAVVATGDVVALALFATIGLLSHHGTVSAIGYARDLLPIAVGWFAAALAFGTYRKRSPARLLATWAVGVPVGIALRALVLGRAFDGKEAAFLGVALTFTLLSVALVRTVLTLAPARHG
jgi:hypothetical protein